MATANYTTKIGDFARDPVFLVKLTITGDVAGSQTFYFSNKENLPINIQLGKDVRPYLMSFKGRPIKIKPDQARTERSRITLTFCDDPDAPDFDSSVFSIYSGGSFWKRLMLAQPDFVGSEIEVLRGFIDSDFAELDFQRIFYGRLEDIDQQADTTFSLICKDILTFNDRQVPAEIGDTNLVDGAMLSTDISFDIDDAEQLTNPSSLSSKDCFPVVVKIEDEYIIASSIVGDTIHVGHNLLNYSEDFNQAIWGAINGAAVTTDTNYGPFGGATYADTWDFATVADGFSQITAVNGEDYRFVFSMWMRLGADATDTTITMEIMLDDDSQSNTNQATLTRSWQRIEVAKTFSGAAANTVKVKVRRQAGDASQIVVFGAQVERIFGTGNRRFYVATSTNRGFDAGRGAFGTTAAAHNDDTAFSEILPYRNQLADTGLHPIFITRDLVNRSGISTSEVDQDSFDDNFEFVQNIKMRRSGTALIAKPRKLSEHIKEVREQGLIDLWQSEAGEVKVNLSWRVNVPGQLTADMNDENNVLWLTSSYKGNRESRITRLFVYFNLVSSDRDGNKPEDYSNAQVVVDLEKEQASGPKSKVLFSKWIYDEADALAIAGRYISRFKSGARIGSWTFELKEDLSIYVGDFINLNSDDIYVDAGSGVAARGDSRWQVISKDPDHRGGKIKVDGLEAVGLRYCIIAPQYDIESGSPTPFPDYPSASGAERQYCFIGDSNNLVNNSTEDGYYIL